jgi:hypothetical protein
MGGAVFNHQGSLTVINSTISANSAIGGTSISGYPGYGVAGGIFNLNGAVTITNSTLDANTAGAVYDLGYDLATARSATITLVNSILANTPAGSDLTVVAVSGGLANATVTATAPNIVMKYTVSGGTMTGSPSTNDPALGPLQYNGGPGMATMTPAPTSPAVQTGQLAGCPPTDERGFGRQRTGGCDQGAVEVGGLPPVIPETTWAILLPLSALIYMGVVATSSAQPGLRRLKAGSDVLM